MKAPQKSASINKFEIENTIISFDISVPWSMALNFKILQQFYNIFPYNNKRKQK